MSVPFYDFWQFPSLEIRTSIGERFLKKKKFKHLYMYVPFYDFWKKDSSLRSKKNSSLLFFCFVFLLESSFFYTIFIL